MSQFDPYASPYAPPTAYSPPELTQLFRPLDGLARWLKVMLILTAIMHTLMVGSNYFIESGAAGIDFENVDPDQAPTVLALAGAILATSALFIITYIVTAVLFCVFAVRANKNARALGALGMEYSPGWCAGWWFIPIANLFMPYKCMKEIYQASNPRDGRHWRHQQMPSTFGAWWGFWIVGSIFSRCVPPLGSLFLLIAAILAVQVINAIIARQAVAATEQQYRQPVPQPLAFFVPPGLPTGTRSMFSE